MPVSYNSGLSASCKPGLFWSWLGPALCRKSDLCIPRNETAKLFPNFYIKHIGVFIVNWSIVDTIGMKRVDLWRHCVSSWCAVFCKQPKIKNVHLEKISSQIPLYYVTRGSIESYYLNVN